MKIDCSSVAGVCLALKELEPGVDDGRSVLISIRRLLLVLPPPRPGIPVVVGVVKLLARGPPVPLLLTELGDYKGLIQAIVTLVMLEDT